MSSWRRRTNSSSGGSSCGACKTLRRKCTQDCVFAPYFPPDNPQKFITVHKVYGASNVTKLLSELHPSQRAAAVESLVHEADLRLKDQVYGCVRPVAILQQNLRQVQETLECARRELANYIGPSAMLPQMQQPQQQPNVYQMMPHHVQQMMIPMQAPHQGQLMILEPGQQQQQSYEDFLQQQQQQLQQEQQQWLQQQQLQQFLEAQQLGAVATSREAEMLRAYEQQLQQVQQQNQQQQQQDQEPEGGVIRLFGDDRDPLTSTGYQMLEQHQLAGIAATREQGMLIGAYKQLQSQQQPVEENLLRSFNDTPPATGFDIQMLQAQQSAAAAAAKEQEMLRAYKQQQQQQQKDDMLKFFHDAGGSVITTNGLGVQMLKGQQLAAVAREQETLRAYEQQPCLTLTGSYETDPSHHIPQEHSHSHLFLQQQQNVRVHLQQTESDKGDKSEDGSRSQIDPSRSRLIKSSSDHAFSS